jgi:hypothetical protein
MTEQEEREIIINEVKHAALFIVLVVALWLYSAWLTDYIICNP